MIQFKRLNRKLKTLAKSRKNLFFIAILPVVIALSSCNSSSNLSKQPNSSISLDNENLEIWWDKGFTIEEDEALQKLVNQWEAQSGKKVTLSFYGTDELFQKVEREFRQGNLPDIIAMFKSEKSLTPRLAWEGKLADVSEVIEPIKSLYPDNVLKAVNFYNNVEQKKSYYALPIHQATIHVYYWKDLLKQAGYSENDIPQEWDKFWAFWPKAQNKLKKQQDVNIYSLGLPLSVEAGDTYQTFEQILEAYDIKILDDNGNLQIDKPEVRQGIIKVLDWYQKTYKQGYFPPDALKWLNPDNNKNLLNKKVLMTTNDTLSIATAVRADADIYNNKLGIVELPNKPNGQPMRYLVTVQQVIVLKDSPHQKEAKEFLSYLIQPNTIGNYLKTAGGRHSPVLKTVWEDSFWTNPKDPHISTATHTFNRQPLRLFYTSDNPAYSFVLKENVWGKAIQKVIVENSSPQQAADEAIKRIKEIFAQWE